MKKVIGSFYRTFFQTLNLSSYDGFSESTPKNTFKYYISLVFNAFLVMLIVMLPAIASLPSTVEKNFDKIDTFDFNINFKTSSPITIPDSNPVLLINYADQTPTQSANIIIDKNVLYTGFLFQKYVKDFSIYKDAKAGKAPVSNIIAVMILLMLPTLIAIFFFYSMIKYFLIILAATIIGMGIAPILRYRISAKKIFNCAVYGSSLSVFLSLIFFALGFQFYYIQYAPLAIFMIAGIFQNGQKIDSKKSNKFIEIKG